MNVRVVGGDIASVGSDALITAINSGGVWHGGIDGVIMRHARGVFHQQAADHMPLHDGQAIVARDPQHHNRGKFSNVIFVVDDLELPLREIIYAGLHAAAIARFVNVTLPTIRMGVMLGVVEDSLEEFLVEIVAAINRFREDGETSVKNITFVVYEDPPTELLLRDALT